MTCGAMPVTAIQTEEQLMLKLLVYGLLATLALNAVAAVWVAGSVSVLIARLTSTVSL